MHRRQFLGQSGAGLLTLGFSRPRLPDPDPARLPRWRGVNLLEKFDPKNQKPFQKRHFRWLKQWGFNFVRLPMSYHCWAEPDPTRWKMLNEAVLRDIDQAVRWGRRYHIHVNLNLHRIPGYCVNQPAEPLNLWQDAEALEAAVFHWQHLARRYRGIPNHRVSFDLINEPPAIGADVYRKVISALVEAIRTVDPARLIIVDGLSIGTKPVPELADLRLGQSTRGYQPIRLTHYRASWIPGSDQYDLPTWPLVQNGVTIDRAYLQKNAVEPWAALQRQGVGVHVGEWGVFHHTPHDVTLRWMEDNLKNWQEQGWGWGLWNLEGSFGFVNSGRKDVAYDDFEGEKLDRKMLELLQRY